MKILRDISKGFLYGQAGLMSGKFSGASKWMQFASGAAMSTAIAASNREADQADLAVFIGMLLPTAVDLTMRVALGCGDYSTNITITVIGVVLSFAANTVDSYAPDEDENFNNFREIKQQDYDNFINDNYGCRK